MVLSIRLELENLVLFFIIYRFEYGVRLIKNCTFIFRIKTLDF